MGKGEFLIMNTEYALQRIQCSRSDKLDCLYIVQQLMDIAFYVRDKGFVALDSYVQEDVRFNDPFLKKAVVCLVDVGDVELVEKILDYYIISGNYSGGQFFKNLVIEETILAVHRRLDAVQIFSFLVPALFGLECDSAVLELFHSYMKRRRKGSIQEM
jgi:hypothetical protein